MKRRIVTEDEIKEYAKNECIKIIAKNDLKDYWFDETVPEKNNWNYQENRNDSFKNIKINKIE